MNSMIDEMRKDAVDHCRVIYKLLTDKEKTPNQMWHSGLRVWQCGAILTENRRILRWVHDSDDEPFRILRYISQLANGGWSEYSGWSSVHEIQVNEIYEMLGKI